MNDKIQTGLRIPEKKYAELTDVAEEVGVSINSLILMIIDLWLTERNKKVSIR